METSISGVALALQNLDNCRKNYSPWAGYHLENNGSARAIGALLQAGMDQEGISPRNISHVICSNGPGSFTGIKVGLSFVYGFAAARADLKFRVECGLEHANSEFARRGELTNSALFLRATKTHGYATSNYPVVMTNLIDASTEFSFRASVEKMNLPSQVYSMGEWPQLENILKSQNLSLKQILVEDVAKASIDGLCKSALCHLEDGFTQVLPAPNYMRLSTAEEQLGREVTGKEL